MKVITNLVGSLLIFASILALGVALIDNEASVAVLILTGLWIAVFGRPKY